jgi:uncharacterized membrane protein
VKEFIKSRKDSDSANSNYSIKNETSSNVGSNSLVKVLIVVLIEALVVVLVKVLVIVPREW